MTRSQSRISLFVFALAISLTAFMSGSYAAETTISVHDAWARPAAVVGGNGAGYFVIENAGDQPDTLLEIKASVSKRVELHSMTMEGTIMKMRRLDSIEVPAKGSVTFKPGGNHVMFIGLAAPLKAADAFPVEFVFSKAGTIKASISVKNPAAAPQSHDHSPHDHTSH